MDIGSGEHKMQVADVDTETNTIVRTIACNVKGVPLANSFLKEGDLSLSVQNASKQAFKELLQEALDVGATEFGGIATATFRKAPSGQQLIEELKSEGKKLVNRDIALSIVTQSIEGQTGYLTAVALSPEFQKDTIVSWDSGNGSFQIVMPHNDGVAIFEGPVGVASATKTLLEKVRNTPYTNHDPINPITVEELNKLLQHLTESFNFPQNLLAKVAQHDTSVVGIGGVTSIFSLGAQATGKSTFTAQEIYTLLTSYCLRALDNTAPEILVLDPSDPSTTIVSLALLYSVMDGLSLREVTYKKSIGNTPGIFLTPDFWPSHKKVVLVFDADQVLLDRTFNIPLMFLCYMLDTTDLNGLSAELPKIINLDSPAQEIPRDVADAFNEFWKKFGKRVCDLDLDPAVDELVEKHPILQQETKSKVPFAEHMKHQCSYGIPRNGTIDLLLKAHTAGHPIAIGTNQGYNTYKRLIDAKTVPHEDYYTVIYTCDHPNNKRLNPRPGQFPYAKKPSGKYFKGLTKALLEKNLGDRLFIFIDDNLENVEVAVKKGFIGIHFQTAEQVENDLKALGINL